MHAESHAVLVDRANELHDYLAKNVGLTADYPIKLLVDNEADARALANLLTRFKLALDSCNNKNIPI